MNKKWNSNVYTPGADKPWKLDKINEKITQLTSDASKFPPKITKLELQIEFKKI
jgi:hypothetical protein